MKTVIALLLVLGLNSGAFAHVVPDDTDRSYDGLSKAERILKSMESPQ